MASDLLQIGRSGTQVARIALDIAAQNIANAASEGYVRRSVRIAEIAPPNGLSLIGDVSVSGARVDGIVRNADSFRQAEVRRTGADAARADAEVAGLENVEAVIEQSNVYNTVVEFEAGLQRLAADPIDPALRAATLEDARTMARSFNMAAQGLDTAGQGLRFEAQAGVDRTNVLTGELARINLRLVRSADASSDRTALLDQRDSLLKQLSGQFDLTTTINANETVDVRVGGASGPMLVSGGTALNVTMATGLNGTISFDASGTSFIPAGGALAGKSQALVKLASVHAALNGIAAGLAGQINVAQTSGVTLDGTPGSALLGGNDAATLAVLPASGSAIATAPVGAGAGSRDASNLDALRNALATSDPAHQTDALIFDISGAVAGRSVTRDALRTIAASARVALDAQSSVDLDQEAGNLIRFQQAFQASSRVMQVASTIFDTLLGIK